MKTIWKIKLSWNKEQRIDLPKKFTVLKLDTQGNDPVLWFINEKPEKPEMKQYMVYAYWTGENIAEIKGDYIGTITMTSKPFDLVYHYFIVKDE